MAFDVLAIGFKPRKMFSMPFLTMSGTAFPSVFTILNSLSSTQMRP